MFNHSGLLITRMEQGVRDSNPWHSPRLKGLPWFLGNLKIALCRLWLCSCCTGTRARRELL